MALDKIRSIDDLVESVYGNHFVERKYIFRGQNNVQWKIKPQLTRSEVNDELKVFELSSFLPLHQNRKIPFLVGKDPIEYLSILQHYRVRTRLLD